MDSGGGLSAEFELCFLLGGRRRTCRRLSNPTLGGRRAKKPDGRRIVSEWLPPAPAARAQTDASAAGDTLARPCARV